MVYVSKIKSSVLSFMSVLLLSSSCMARSSRGIKAATTMLPTTTAAFAPSYPITSSSRCASKKDDYFMKHDQYLRQLDTASTPVITILNLNHHQRFACCIASRSNRNNSRRQLFSTSLFMSAVEDDSDDDNDNDNDNKKTLESEWDIKGLKQEVSRLTMRAHKKVGKASARLRKTQELVDALRVDENATMEQLEACPNVDVLELELKQIQTRLQTLNRLNDMLAPMKGGISVLPEATAQLALDIKVNDQPPARPARGPKKIKGPRTKNPPKTRVPYRCFYSKDKTEIRVGKQAQDNDELSLSPEHRSGSDWWMHASGCPGSHVVIRRSDENLDDDIIQDSAALAARHSKCTGNTIKVSMTRCRHIQKPKGAKAGLVQLTGPVRSIVVNMKEAQKRLDRLDSTVDDEQWKMQKMSTMFLVSGALSRRPFSTAARRSSLTEPKALPGQIFSGKKQLPPLFGSSSSNSDSLSSSGKSLSAAGRERREEDQRRRQRKDEVVIGKTSAKRGETDFALNPKATEEEYLRQASRVEQEVFHLTNDGMECLKMLRIEEANAAFDKVFELKPNAYLWQAGIAKFYMGDFENAANLFTSNAMTYESKFGGTASEERIWRHACELKMANLRSKRVATKGVQTSNLIAMPELDEDPDSLFAETRKVIRIARDLFAASVNNDQSGVMLARAKLRSIGGSFDALAKADMKLWKLSAWFYLGLHYDVIGEMDESKECVKMALFKSNGAGRGDNILHTLPVIHMSQREWYDDDDMDNDPLKLLRPSEEKNVTVFNPDNDRKEEDAMSNPGLGTMEADPLFADSLRKSLAKMRYVDLQDAMRVRGIKAQGSKGELQNRLFRSLMGDAGYTS